MKIIAVVICLLLTSWRGQAALITFSFTGGTASPDSQPTGANVSDMIRGSGLAADTYIGEFNAHNWTINASRDLNDYYAFTIAPNPNYTMALTRLELDETRSGEGIRTWEIYSSLDNYGTALITFNVPDDDKTRKNEGVDLSSAFNELSSAVTFRIYGFEAKSPAGTWHVDNVELFGNLTPVPEPPAWGVISGVGMLVFCGFQLWRRCKLHNSSVHA